MHDAAGQKAFQEGDYAESEKELEAALRKAEEFGSEDPRLSKSLNNLALLYKVQGKYAEAEPLYKRSLAIREKALGPEHPNVATALENYAALLRETGRNAEAHRLDARAKAIRAKQTEENPSN
jgi:tetratricopeptide (TPR) repeat protein